MTSTALRRPTVAGRAVVVPLVFAAWTLFVWVGRLRNLIREPGPLADTSRWSLAWSIAFTVLGLALVGAVALAATGRAGRPLGWAVASLGVLTVAVWVPRAIDIALGDHSVGFILVHVALATVSISLAVAAWRGLGEGERPVVGYPRNDG